MPIRGPNHNRPPTLGTIGVNSLNPDPNTSDAPSLSPLDMDWSDTNHVVMSPAVRDKVKSNLDSFYDTIRTSLHHDAASLARGEMPYGAGDPLTPDQQDELQDATLEMLKGMPISALAPQATERLRGMLEAQGMEVENLETKTLDELGDVGGDFAEHLADKIKSQNPGVYYGVAATAAAAIGAVGYLEGSDKLRELGIKPEVKTSLFDNQLTLKAEADWGKKFSDPSLRLNSSGSTSLGNLMIGHHLSYDTDNPDALSGGMDLRSRNGNHIGFNSGGDWEEGFHETNVFGGVRVNDSTVLNGTVSFDEDLRYSGANLHTLTRLNNSGHARFDLNLNEDGDVQDVRGELRVNGNNWNAAGEVRHDFLEDRTTGRLSANYTPSENVEFSAFGEMDTRGESRVGLGLTWRF